MTVEFVGLKASSLRNEVSSDGMAAPDFAAAIWILH